MTLHTKNRRVHSRPSHIPYWIIGGICGFIIINLLALYGSFGPGSSAGYEDRGIILLPVAILMIPIEPLLQWLGPSTLTITIIPLLYYTGIGMLIGWVYGKIHSKQKIDPNEPDILRG